MDKQEYLNQISAGVHPPQKGLPGLFRSKIFWIIVSAVFAFIVLAIIGGIISSGRVTVKDRVITLILHIDNTDEAISTYQDAIKSSDLRSYSASLYSVLAETSRNLANFATEAYDYNPKKIPEKILTTETAAKDELNNELFEAKINGILDRIYAHKMAYEISLITTNEQQILNASNNENLAAILSPSYDSLANLYTKFDEFSETK